MIVIRQQILYAAEYVTLTKKKMMEELDITEPKILRKISTLLKQQYRKRHSNGQYSRMDKIADAFRKTRFTFHRHF